MDNRNRFIRHLPETSVLCTFEEQTSAENVYTDLTKLDLPQIKRFQEKDKQYSRSYSPVRYEELHGSRNHPSRCEEISTSGGHWPMTCEVKVHFGADDNFGMTVLVMTPGGDEISGSVRGKTAAKSLFPKSVSTGPLTIRLYSEDFKADISSGEDESLTKIENNFQGLSFEKQYALVKTRKGSFQGVFGRLVIESDNCSHPIFELNLTACDVTEEPETAKTEVTRMSVTLFKEFAAMLNLLEDSDSWEAIAHQIGFTQHEIKQISNNTQDPISEMLINYHKRRGTPEELTSALYELKRRQNLQTILDGKPCDSDLTSQPSFLSSVSAHFTRDTEADLLVDAVTLTPPSTPHRRRIRNISVSSTKKRRLFLDLQETKSKGTELDDLADAETIPVTDIETDITTPCFPPSPPGTPRTPLKRLTGSLGARSKPLPSIGGTVFVFPDLKDAT